MEELTTNPTLEQNPTPTPDTPTPTPEPNKDPQPKPVKTYEDLLKELGVDDPNTLKEMVKNQRELEDANRTEVEKKDTALQNTLKELAEEREQRMKADAKLSAISLGAKIDLVEDLVTIALAKVTKDKDINAIIAEIKDGNTGSVYFEFEEDKDVKPKTNFTRKRVEEPNKDPNKTNVTVPTAGTLAERLAQKRQNANKQSAYFKK